MSPLPSFLSSAPPTVGLEIASDRVTAVSLGTQGGSYTIAGHATQRLPAGAVTPALNAANIQDRGAVAAAVRAAFESLGTRARRVALVIPDAAAKVSLLRFEKVPAAADLDQLIHWQVRKAAPFKPEESQVSWVPAAPLPEGGREFLVTLARRDIVESYEQVCADAGAHTGVVDLATLNLVNAALASRGSSAVEDPSTGASDWLVVHVAPEYATLTIVRGHDVIYFRTRQLEAEGDLADLVHQTAMYHEDRLGGSRFARVLLSGAYGRPLVIREPQGLPESSRGATSSRAVDGGDRVRRGLEERLGVQVDPLDFRGTAAMTDRVSAGPELLDMLAPAVGVLLRERVA